MRKEQVISTTNNNQMEEKGMKSRFIHLKKRFVPAVSGALMGVMLMSTTCFAAVATLPPLPYLPCSLQGILPTYVRDISS